MTRDQELLIKVADQLERWANESVTGHWSTHQVDPMRKLADEIRREVLTSGPRF